MSETFYRDNSKIFVYSKENQLLIDIELPGMNPKEVKLSFVNKEVIQLNGVSLFRVAERYDLTKATAELRFGLLTITVPENTDGKGEIPLTVQ